MRTRVEVARELFRMRYEAAKSMSEFSVPGAMTTAMHPRGNTRDLSGENLDGRVDPETLANLKYLDLMDVLMVKMLMTYYGYEIMNEFSNGQWSKDRVRALLLDPQFKAIIHGGVGHWQAFVKRDGAYYDLNSSFTGTDTRRIPLGLDDAVAHIADGYMNNRAFEKTVRRNDGTVEKVLQAVSGQMVRRFFAFRNSTALLDGFRFTGA